MIQYVKQGGDFGRAFIQQLKERSANSGKKVDDAVAEIVETVRRDGDAAVRMYTERFDGSVPEQLVIEKADMQELIKACDPAFVAALERAAANIRDFHARQKQQSWLQTEANGVIMGQRVRGLARVGLYVPGGTAAYP
ncbi:MAG: histidinol dehydrogenase, partial [Anaeromassilibacillus sp.]